MGISVSLGTGVFLLIALYFIIKWAVKNGVKEAWKDITGDKTAEEKAIAEYYTENE